MDIIFIGDTQIITIEKIDCMRINNIGYEYFSMIFSPLDWERIKEFPESGLIFTHFLPDVYLLMLYAGKPGWSLDERIDKVGIYHRKILKYMMEQGLSMPKANSTLSIFD